ncbi:hypothetical protein CYMTET_24433, partial [Cymbomonas tetramitiformis]
VWSESLWPKKLCQAVEEHLGKACCVGYHMEGLLPGNLYLELDSEATVVRALRTMRPLFVPHDVPRTNAIRVAFGRHPNLCQDLFMKLALQGPVKLCMEQTIDSVARFFDDRLLKVDQAADGANTEKAAAVVDVWLSKQWDTDKGVRCGVIELFNSDFVSAALLLDSQPLAWGVLLKVAPYSTRPATTLSDGTSAPVLSGIEAVDTSVQNLKRACEASLGDGEPAINACTEAIDHNDQEWVQPDPGLLTAAADPPSARQLMLGKRPRAEGESTSAQAPELQLQVARATEMKHTIAKVSAGGDGQSIEVLEAQLPLAKAKEQQGI